MSRSKWGGSESRAARKACTPLLGRPCPRCGKPVVPRPWLKADGWHPDHYPVSREMGGTQVVPAHDNCNTSDGGRRGAQITNARRKTNTQPHKTKPENQRGIRGV